MMATLPHNPLDWNNPKDTSGSEQKLIPEDPQCSLCKYAIQEINEIFEQHDSSWGARDYCITHLLEAMITALVWRLSKQ